MNVKILARILVGVFCSTFAACATNRGSQTDINTPQLVKQVQGDVAESHRRATEWNKGGSEWLRKGEFRAVRVRPMLKEKWKLLNEKEIADFAHACRSGKEVSNTGGYDPIFTYYEIEFERGNGQRFEGSYWPAEDTLLVEDHRYLIGRFRLGGWGRMRE